MPVNTSVKFFHSGLTGAPVMSGQAGSLIAVLDACLVNGWGTATVDSVVISAGIATVTRGAGHPFEADMVCEISGATVTGGTLNGQRKVLSVISATQYTIDADGIPNQTATGTISHKVAAAGWEKPFSGTNLAVYRSPDVTGNRFFLRVDDSANYQARVIAYENMTDVNTGTGPFPTTAQLSGGFYWPRSNETTAGSAPRRWAVFADTKFFQLPVNWSDAVSVDARYGYLSFFGDLIRPAGSTDTYASVLNGGITASAYASAPGTSAAEYHTTQNGSSMYCPRPFSAIGTPLLVDRGYATLLTKTNGVSSGDTSTNHIAFPNPTDGGVYIAPWTAVDAQSNYRGAIPGYYAIPQRCGAGTFANRQRFTDVSALPGRAVRMLNTGVGAVAVDCTGPWA